MVYLEPLTALRLQRGVEHLHWLGPRALAEFLREIGVEHGFLSDIVARVDEWGRHLTPDMVRVAGGDRFPPPALRVVPEP